MFLFREFNDFLRVFNRIKFLEIVKDFTNSIKVLIVNSVKKTVYRLNFKNFIKL